MKVVLWMDTERLLAIKTGGIYIPLTFEFNRAGEMVLDTRAYKFVLLGDGICVIAPIGDHRDLLAVYITRELPIPETIEAIKNYREQPYGKNFNGSFHVIGAGMVTREGKVEEWKSTGLGVTTPVELRAPIQQEISRLFQAGVLILPVG